MPIKAWCPCTPIPWCPCRNSYVSFAYKVCFLPNDFLEKFDRKVTNVSMNDRKLLQAVLPAAKGDLGVSSARLLALPDQLFSLSRRSETTLCAIFGLEHEDETSSDALEFWFGLTKCEVAPKNESQKKIYGARC